MAWEDDIDMGCSWTRENCSLGEDCPCYQDGMRADLRDELNRERDEAEAISAAFEQAKKAIIRLFREAEDSRILRGEIWDSTRTKQFEHLKQSIEDILS